MISTRHHVPERTCIACRKKKTKGEMVRLVHSLEGIIRIDYNKKEPGRGAYLCNVRECWELALAKDKKDRLAHALKTNITPENRRILSEYGGALPSTLGMMKGTK